MRLVRFDDGTFGIRMFWFWGWYFVDLETPRYSWKMGQRFFCDCKGTEEHARRIFSSLKKENYEVVE